MRLTNFRRLAWLLQRGTVVHRLGGFTPMMGTLVLELTYRCNLMCEMCPQARDRDLPEAQDATVSDIPGRMSDMPMETVRKLIDQAYESCYPRPVVHLMGGEPFLHKEFPAIVEHIKNKSMRISVSTNGSLLQTYASEIVRLGLDMVVLSLDGPEPIHNQVRGTAWAFKRASEGITALQMAKQSRGATAPSISANCVITTTNYTHLPEVIEVAAKLGIASLSFQHLMFDDGADIGIDVDRLISTIPLVHREAEKHGLSVSFYPRLTTSQIRRYYTEPSVNLAGTCIMPWFTARALANGVVTPCRGFVIGNANDENFSLSQAWNSKPIRSYRQRIAKKGLFADCGRCCHRIYTE